MGLTMHRFYQGKCYLRKTEEGLRQGWRAGLLSSEGEERRLTGIPWAAVQSEDSSTKSPGGQDSCPSNPVSPRKAPAIVSCRTQSLAWSSHWIVWPLRKPSPGSPSTAAGALVPVFSLCESSAGACWQLTQKPVLLSHRLLVNQQKTCQNIPCKTADLKEPHLFSSLGLHLYLSK